MKPTFSKFFVLVLLITFISISTASPVSTQAPEPPEILENGEFPTKLDQIEQALAERNDVALNGGDNSINVVNTWFSSSGWTFVPASSSITYYYSGFPCVDTSADYEVWRGSVNLPNGSTITGMYFNYYNEGNDPADSRIWLKRYGFDGVEYDILSVTGTYTGAGFHTHWTSEVANNLVNNNDYVYVLSWMGRAQQNLCGINLEYTPPPFYLQALPMITR